MGAAALAGRTVLLTGVAGDMGAAYTHALTLAGANVLAVDLPSGSAAGTRTAASATAAGAGRAVFATCDVTSERDWHDAVRLCVREFGGLDVLVNNAAVYRDIGAKKPLTELSVADWDRMLTVNVRGTWQGIKAVVPALTESGGGSIVNVSSIVARTGAAGFAHYVASKAAVEGLTRAAARELGPLRIRVNAIAPGLVSNAATRALNRKEYLVESAAQRAVGRQLVPADIVGALVWLASADAGPVTGQTLVVDGGQVFI